MSKRKSALARLLAWSGQIPTHRTALGFGREDVSAIRSKRLPESSKDSSTRCMRSFTARDYMPGRVVARRYAGY